MDPGLVDGLKVLFLPLLTSACVGQPEGSRCVNVPCSAVLAVMGHQQNVLKLPRIQANVISPKITIWEVWACPELRAQPQLQCGSRR